MRQDVNHPNVVVAESFGEVAKDGAKKSLASRRQTFGQLTSLRVDGNDRLVDLDQSSDDLLPDAVLDFELRAEDGQGLIQGHDVSDHVVDH